MRKIQKNIVPVLTLSLLEVCYFIFEIYPKKLFDVRLINPVYNYLPDFLTKLIWLLLYTAVVILICKRVFFNEHYAFVSEYFKDLLNCSIKIFFIRLLTDIIILLSPPLKYVDAYQYILDLLFTVILFLIVFKRINSGKKIIKFNKKMILYTSILIFVSVLYVLISIYKTSQGMAFINYLDEKYVSIPILNETQALSFELSLYTLLFNIISVILIYIIFINTFENSPQTDKVKNILIATRCFLVITGLFFFCVVKMVLIPQNMLAAIDTDNTNVVKYSEPNTFDRNFRSINLFRLQGYYREDKLVYSKSTVKITYGNKTVASFKRKISLPDESITDHGDGIYSFNTEVIMYIDNNEPVAVLTKDINKQKENEKLTEVLEKLICSNSFEYLEYSCDYMLKYDKNYIKPFLEEYSQGIYDEKIDENIEKEYIIEFSQNVLQNNFSD